MPVQSGRYTAAVPATAAEGWSLERITPPSRLYGANGLRNGPDGRIYVAQVSGSQISAIDIDSGAIEVISAKGGDIVAPDDIAFDDEGNIYATEITEDRVSMYAKDGTSRVIAGDIGTANPITFHQGRLIAGELKIGGRVLELDRNGGAPKVLLKDIPMTNGFAFGPDGKLYMPIMATNEIWRADIETGEHEVVAGELGVPDAVKFDSQGYIVSTQVASGQVLRIDPRTGEKTVLAQLTPGLDNLAYVGERLFVSNIAGHVSEILADGGTRNLVPEGLNWPLGLAMGDDGVLFVADGSFNYLMPPGGPRQTVGFLFFPGTPGYTRGVGSEGNGAFVVTTATGNVARYWPAKAETEVLASGFDQLFGVATAPGGAVVFAELGKGRVLSVENGNVEELASGLADPKGIAFDSAGKVLVSETAGGRVVRLSGGKAETVVDGLTAPEGLLVLGSKLYIVDPGAKSVVEFNLDTGARETIASGLPIGSPPGVVPKFIGGIGDLSGPMGSFAGITAGADGTLYVSGDGEGSVLTLRRR